MESTRKTAQEMLDQMIYPSLEGQPIWTLSWDFREFGRHEDNHAARDEAKARLGDWIIDEIEFDTEMSCFYAYSDNRDALVAVARLLAWDEPTHSWADIAEGTLPDLVEFQAEMDRLYVAENDDELAFGVDQMADGTPVGLWFAPGIIENDEYDRAFIGLDGLRQLREQLDAALEGW